MTKIIAIGASAGGLEAIGEIVAKLPRSLSVPIVFTEHVGAGRSVLPTLLARFGPLPACHPRSGDPLRPGTIFVAPPDHHLRVENGHIELSRGPKENWSRPAVDPMFRSIAAAYGPDATGVILSGALNDGTAGLYEIKRYGGKTVVQDPVTAAHPGMPRSAVNNVEIDYCMPVSEIPDLLIRLVQEEVGKPSRRPAAPGIPAMNESHHTTAQPVALTCPECGGAMRKETTNNLTLFRCHIGHAMTSEVLSAQQVDLLEKSLESVLRSLSEREALCREMAEKEQARGHRHAAAMWRNARAEAVARRDTLLKLTELDWAHPEEASELGHIQVTRVHKRALLWLG